MESLEGISGEEVHYVYFGAAYFSYQFLINLNFGGPCIKYL